METQAKDSHSSPGTSNGSHGGGRGGRAMPVAVAGFFSASK
jgi:hypothetical protein